MLVPSHHDDSALRSGDLMHLAPRTASIASTVLALLVFLATPCAGALAASVAPAPFLRLTGAAPGDRFGSAVSAAGDVNGDGFSDIVVGSEWSDADAPNAGRAYVYFGGPLADDLPDLTLQVPIVQSRSLTGYAVAIAGDINGDGWTDIAVGSPVSQFMGRVFLYWGGPSLDAISDRTLGGLRSLEFFGAALAGVGDANGDGFDDLWVGAPRFVAVNSSASRVGRGYLFYGGPSADGIVDVTFEARPIAGITDELQFGTSVAPAGDVNGDGFADILVGQPADGTFTMGRAYIYHGGNPVHRAPDRAFLPPAYRFRAGTSVSPAGDFNADGAADFLVGAPDSGEEGEITAGRAYLYFGGQELPDAAEVDIELAGPGAYDAFGAAVAGGADVSGDGYPDLLVGAPQSEGVNGIRAGKVYVYYGGPGADATADVVLEGPASDGTLGTSISLGDVNGDGVADAVVGAAGLQGSRTDPGHLFVYDLVAPLPARAFAHDEHRTIPLNEDGAPVCLRVEPLDGAFEIRDLDLASIRLRSIDGLGES
ncbi:MAG TPA: integrin alpha, partial [Candidatus Eisenbacteria bacterium]